MAKKPRLKELLAQKKLIESHLAWLENEIAKECPVEERPPRNRLGNDQESQNQANAKKKSLTEAQAIEDIYEELGPDTKSAKTDAKRGCLIFFALAFLALGALAAWTYLYY